MKDPKLLISLSLTRIALYFKRMGGTKDEFNKWTNAVWDDMDLHDPVIFDDMLRAKLEEVSKED